MTRPKTPESYKDALNYLEQALTNGGLRLTLASYNTAVAYRQRLYRARRAGGRPELGDLIIRLAQNGEALPPVFQPTAAQRATPTEVWIELRTPKVLAVATLSGEAPIPAEPVEVPEPLDPELAEALAKAKADLRLDTL